MKAILLGLLALTAAPNENRTPNTSKADGALAHLRAGALAAQRNDCRTTLKEVVPVLDGDTTPLSETALAAGYDLAIGCSARLDDMAKAGEFARRATALQSASDLAWLLRFFADYESRRYPQAIETLEAMTQGRGRALNQLDLHSLWGLHRDLDKAKLDALDKRLLAIMIAPSFEPVDVRYLLQDGRGSAQALLAGKLLAEGDREGAAKLVAGLASVSALTDLAFNADLRRLTSSMPDLRAAATADLALRRELKIRYPDSLSAFVAEANSLRQLGRPAEAIAALEQARARITNGPAFADQDDILPWWWNELAYAHSDAGDYAAMLAAFSSGAAVKEGEALNVSQVINLGSQQVAFGKFDEALKTVDTAFLKRDMSPFGRMQALSVRGCAFALSGKTAEAQATLRDAQAHEADDPATVSDLLLCTGDEAGAAASYVRRLGDPKLRPTALKELARYPAPLPGAPSDPRQVRREKVAQRPEVQAALTAAGGALDILLQRESLGW